MVCQPAPTDHHRTILTVAGVHSSRYRPRLPKLLALAPALARCSSGPAYFLPFSAAGAAAAFSAAALSASCLFLWVKARSKGSSNVGVVPVD